MTLTQAHAPSLFSPRITVAGAFCLCLSLWGCLAIYNATCHLSPPYWFVGRQLVWIGLGAAALVTASACTEAFYREVLPYAAAGIYVLLWLVLWCGIRINGMRGWFSYRGVFMQPSELAKPVFVLCMAWVMERTSPYRQQWLRGYAPVAAVLVLWTLPIALQPDFGCVAVYAVTFVIVYWCMGGNLRHLGISSLAAVPVLWLVLRQHPYVWQRLTGYLNPEAHASTAGWHMLQFQRALASGGLTGRSWGNSFWSQSYLPLGYSDSIFAATAEAIGFLGVLPVIVVVLAWVLYGYSQGCKARTQFGAGTIMGLVSILAAQAFIHLSVNLGLLPATGVTLPLISYGGSSLVSTLAAVGVVEGISRRRAAEMASELD